MHFPFLKLIDLVEKVLSLYFHQNNKYKKKNNNLYLDGEINKIDFKIFLLILKKIFFIKTINHFLTNLNLPIEFENSIPVSFFLKFIF